MSFLIPGFLLAAAAISGAVIALHFIVTRNPRTTPLPTARFVPDRPVQARARTLAPSDFLLLLLRVGLVLLVGAALARPVRTPTRRSLARIFVVDRSRAAVSASEVADTVGKLAGVGDVVVPFDSLADRGRITSGLILGLRAAVERRDAVDSLELVLVSPLAREELDQATDSVRALWPGRIRLVLAALRVDSAAPAVVDLSGSEADPLRLALPVRLPGEPTARFVRGFATAADSAWAARPGHVLVQWPADVPAGAVRDTVGAVSSGDVVLVASFARGPPPVVPAGARVAARWVDGEPAAFETGAEAGCIRTVLIPVPTRGDLVLDPRFAALVARLAEPCGGQRLLHPSDSAARLALAGPAPSGRVAAHVLGRPEHVRAPLVPWLLGGALALAAGELVLRRRRGAPVPGRVPA